MKIRIRLLIATVGIFLGVSVCHASWLIYHKPEFKGKVVDLETDEPIEGAVVVALYEKETFSPPVEPHGSYIYAQETLTDKNGEFKIPSYTTLINPFSWSARVDFIVFKPGYVWVQPFNLQDIFSGKGTSDMELFASWNKDLKVIVLKSSIVRLPTANSNRDRIESFNSTGDIYDFKKELPISFEIMQKERLFVIELEKQERIEK